MSTDALRLSLPPFGLRPSVALEELFASENKLGYDPAMNEKQDALARVAGSAIAVKKMTERLNADVQRARADSCTWRDIASALGTTPSNAHRKYASKGKQR